jgi:flagellar biosynthesis protein FlhB
MSRQEIRDEHKQQEGDPHVKGRINVVTDHRHQPQHHQGAADGNHIHAVHQRVDRRFADTKLSPLAGFKRMFAAQAWTELFKGILKTVLVGCVA